MKKTSNNGFFTRTHFPLDLSLAFTIHKSQGETLERLVIDFGEVDKCSGQSNGLHSFLYLAKRTDVMLTYNLCTPVGLSQRR